MTSFSKRRIEDLEDCLSLQFSNEGNLSPSNDVCQKSQYSTSLSQTSRRFHSASMVQQVVLTLLGQLLSLSNFIGPHIYIYVLSGLENRHTAFLFKELKLECLPLGFYLLLLFSISVMLLPTMADPLNFLSQLYLQSSHQNLACYYVMASRMTNGCHYQAYLDFVNFSLLIIFSLNFVCSIICCFKEFSLIVRISIVQVSNFWESKTMRLSLPTPDFAQTTGLSLSYKLLDYLVFRCIEGVTAVDSWSSLLFVAHRLANTHEDGGTLEFGFHGIVES